MDVKRLEWERQNRLRIPFEKNLTRLLKNYFNDLATALVLQNGVSFEHNPDRNRTLH